jgi:hypothetical protein
MLGNPAEVLIELGPPQAARCAFMRLISLGFRSLRAVAQCDELVRRAGSGKILPLPAQGCCRPLPARRP